MTPSGMQYMVDVYSLASPQNWPTDLDLYHRWRFPTTLSFFKLDMESKAEPKVKHKVVSGKRMAMKAV